MESILGHSAGRARGMVPQSDDCLMFSLFQIVILKELKPSDGYFSKGQRIELNTVRLKYLPLHTQVDVHIRSVQSQHCLHLYLVNQLKYLYLYSTKQKSEVHVKKQSK